MKHLSLVSATTCVAVLMVGCDRAPSIAGPQRISSAHPAFEDIVNRTDERDVPWADSEQDPCTGDMVSITGLTHFKFYTEFEENGDFKLKTEANSKGNGVGAPSMFMYKVKDETSYNEQDHVAKGSTIEQKMKIEIDGPRHVDDYEHEMSFKIHLDATGVPTAEMDKTKTECEH